MTDAMFDPHAIDEALDSFVDAVRVSGAGDSAEAALFIDAGRRALVGGKRLRARFLCAAWQAIAPEGEALPSSVIDAGAAVEVFQAAALVHDDLIDNSDTRRGAPAAHKALEAQHATRAWLGDAAAFGRSAAILLGDLLVAWSDDLFERALDACDDREVRRAAREVYARMRRDVTVGQFMDLAGEAAWAHYPDAEQAARALTIAEMKSARYSIVNPLEIGAALGGATTAQSQNLEAFGLPLGIAFQLRDDLLGVFGDEAHTGKPSGDDVREGKRTALIAWAREGLGERQRTELDALLGKRDLSPDELEHARALIGSTNAPARTEALIAENLAAAQTALARATITDAGRAALETLAEASVKRSA